MASVKIRDPTAETSQAKGSAIAPLTSGQGQVRISVRVILKPPSEGQCPRSCITFPLSAIAARKHRLIQDFIAVFRDSPPQNSSKTHQKFIKKRKELIPRRKLAPKPHLTGAQGDFGISTDGMSVGVIRAGKGLAKDFTPPPDDEQPPNLPPFPGG